MEFKEQSKVKSFSTEQEHFWAGDFGTSYISRNQSQEYLASNLNFFSRACRIMDRPESILEFGANIGMNIKALQLLYPGIHAEGIEINDTAADELERVIDASNVHRGSIFSFSPVQTYDLCLIKGVLIHIHPDKLPVVYEKLYTSTHAHILICEYYNPSPVSVPYRGHQERLFKRDFAGEMMDRYPDLKLIDYGFSYHLDPQFPQDDITWFLLKKS